MKIQYLVTLLLICILATLVTADNEVVNNNDDIDPISYSIELSNNENELDQKSNIQSRSIPHLLQKLRHFNIYKSFAPFGAHRRRRTHNRHRHRSDHHSHHTSRHHRHRHRCNDNHPSTNDGVPSSGTHKCERHPVPTTSAPKIPETTHSTPTTRPTTTTTTTTTTTPRYNDPDNELIDPIDLRFGGV